MPLIISHRLLWCCLPKYWSMLLLKRGIIVILLFLLLIADLTSGFYSSCVEISIICYLLVCFFMHARFKIKYLEISYSLLIKIFYVLNRWTMWSQRWLQGSRFIRIVSIGSLWYVGNLKGDLHIVRGVNQSKDFVDCWHL